MQNRNEPDILRDCTSRITTNMIFLCIHEVIFFFQTLQETSHLEDWEVNRTCVAILLLLIRYNRTILLFIYT